MTVAELIEILKAMPQDMPVEIGYEGIAKTVDNVRIHTWPNGHTFVMVEGEI